jgi:flagellar protein FliO/FliZ
MMGRHINIVETISLGTDKKLHLVKAGEQYLLIYSTSKSVELISEVRLDGTADEEKPESAAFQNAFDFKSVFEKYAGVYKNIKGFAKGNMDGSSDAAGSDRQNFRSNLIRLRNITKGVTGSDLKNEDESTDEKKV